MPAAVGSALFGVSGVIAVLGGMKRRRSAAMAWRRQGNATALLLLLLKLADVLLKRRRKLAAGDGAKLGPSGRNRLARSAGLTRLARLPRLSRRGGMRLRLRLRLLGKGPTYAQRDAKGSQGAS